MRVTLRPRFHHLEGHCWFVEPDRTLFPESDDIRDPGRSCLIVSENDVDLGPAHSPIQTVAQRGRGLYSHWNHVLYFSATDNSDPNDNRRRYAIRWDTHEYFRRKAQYAIAVVESWARHLHGGVSQFRDKQVVEVGPGRDMGTIAILAALGAEVIAVDRFFGAWQAGWHDAFLSAVAAALNNTGWSIDLNPIHRAIEGLSISVPPITVIQEPLEDIGHDAIGRADLTVSHSTFEHFFNFQQAAHALFRLSRKGAVAQDQASFGVHNVDFRDHRNFGEPLEFLLVDEKGYADQAINNDYRRGNRLRPTQMIAGLVRAGFRTGFLPTETAEQAVSQELCPAPAQGGGKPIHADIR
jgi:hypothetical protein